MPHRLTSLGALSRPAENATISSVPPAIGVHAPGSAAISSSTLAKLPGATSWWASALPRIVSLFQFGLRFNFGSV